MVNILTDAYVFLVGVINILPAPLYYFIQLFFGSIILSAVVYLLNKFSDSG